MNKSEMIRALARKKGLCDAWTSEWNDNCSDDELIYKFVEGQNFCLKYDVPGINILRSTENEVLLNHNVYCDYKGTIHNPTDDLQQKRIVICGDSDIDIILDGYTICDIFIHHNSNVRIFTKDNAICYVNVAGSAKISVINESVNAPSILNYSKEVSVSTIGIVKYHDKTEHGKQVSISAIK